MLGNLTRRCADLSFQEHPLQIKNRGGNFISTGDHQHRFEFQDYHHQDIFSWINLCPAGVTEDSLLVLVANALPHWLLKGTKVGMNIKKGPRWFFSVNSFKNQASDKFFSAPHAVPGLDYGLLSRVVFARMKVTDDKDFGFRWVLLMMIITCPRWCWLSWS